MKILSIVLSALLLSACASISSFSVAPFNGSEYEKISHLRDSIALDSANCKDFNKMQLAAIDLNNQAFELVLYSQGLPKNNEVTNMEKNLHLMTSELAKRYSSMGEVSETYCDNKMAILLRTAGTIQKSVGAKPQ